MARLTNFSKEKMMKKIVVEIEASDWNQEKVDSFRDWLNNELEDSNQGSGDDVHVVSVRIVD